MIAYAIMVNFFVRAFLTHQFIYSAPISFEVKVWYFYVNLYQSGIMLLMQYLTL